MRNTNNTVSKPHLFSPISALIAESNSYIVRFNVHETFQINQSNSLISNNAFVQFLWINIRLYWFYNNSLLMKASPDWSEYVK